MRKNKKIFTKELFIGAVWLTDKLYTDKKRMEKCKNKDKIIEKQEAVLASYEQWVEAFQNGLCVGNYLLAHNYHKVAIYGLGRLGKQLYRELSSSGIEVIYVIDATYGSTSRIYQQTPCFHPKDRLPEAELIIVTIPNEAKEITNQLREKITCPIKAINELLFVL